MAEQLAVDTKAEASASPEKNLRRWLLEIKVAEKREKEWRATAKKVIDTYRGTKARKNSFNILWANTEVLRPAIYNSTPKPDVRRRWRSEDILGKAVSEVMERGLTYCVDAYDLDSCLKNDVLDALLPGRGLSRVRYIPQIKTVPAASPGAPPAAADAVGEAFQGTHEEVEYEQALCDHVQWDDFIHGTGKTWQEVPWVGFRHKLCKDDIIEKFGNEIADKITLNDVADDTFDGKADADKETFKRAEFWEVWDKDGEKVFFVNESYKPSVIYPVGESGEPPLKLKNFFPCPQPLMMVEDTGSLLPLPLYELYREQAEELDRITARITKIVNACRVRFVHDPTLSELAELMKAGDNEGIPAENARAWMTNGGLEKAIWWMPIVQVAAVLKELYVARDSCKQVIYEITGLSDIIRGQSDPNETLGAQKLKANSSSMRLQRMQREVQRYVRDLIRLLAEVMGENFAPETLAKMTGLNFPTAQQKQAIQLQIQAGQQQLQGQPVPPELQQKLQQAQQALSMPSWEDIMGVLRSDMQREYRVDVETDSTVAESLTKDMQGMKEVLTSVVEVIQGFGPAVQAGAVKADAVKAIVMAVVRRARMGLEVEDALESGIQEPKPQNDPRAAAEAQKQQLAEQQAGHDAQMAQREQAHQEQIAQREQALAQAEEQRQQLVELGKHEREQQQAATDAALEKQRMDYEARLQAADAERTDEFNRWKVTEDNATKIAVAEISAKASVDASLAKAEQAANDEIAEDLTDDGADKAAAKTKKRTKPIDRIAEMHGQTTKAIADLTAALAKPKRGRIIRGPNGRADGIETIQ